VTWPDDVRAAECDGAEFAHLAMPLGGIGTGNLAICADGGLRQWQLHNIGNHGGALPGSFFALRVSRWEPPLDEVLILQASPRDSTDTPLVTDDVVPDWQRDLLSRHPGVARTTFCATYPVARVRYLDAALPLEVTLEAFNPLVPLDVDASSIPVALFTFRLVNDGEYPLHGTLGAAVQNAVGWDGVTPIDGVHAPGYGGNTNRLLRREGWTSVVLENGALPDDAPGAGQMVLAADDPQAAALTRWRHAGEFVTFLRSRALASGSPRLALAAGIADPQRHAPQSASGASPPGCTWHAGLGVPFLLQPGQQRLIRVALTWYFPNRYVNFEQFGPDRPEWGRSRFWLGNHYATRYTDAQDVFERVRRDWYALREATGAWTGTLAGSGLDDAAVTHLAAQLATVRSPTCFRAADGRLFAFEGVLGASTVMWSGRYGGSCPLNCTHVWNYAQALAAAFPELERSMRETELETMQAPAGYVPHRVIAPIYLPQLWGEPIGGPDQPALDGMLGTVLKAYREYRAGAGIDWLRRYWPNLTRLLRHVDRTWNVDGTGMLCGVQPSTHDIDLTGRNPFMGTLWLAALRAAEQMALLLDDSEAASAYRTTFSQASESYDAALFTGEYYAQRLLPGDNPDSQWGDGCLADQLIGQWWAHQLDLGQPAARRARAHRPGRRGAAQPAPRVQGPHAPVPGVRGRRRLGAPVVYLAARWQARGPDPLRRRGVDRLGIPGGRALLARGFAARGARRAGRRVGALRRAAAQPVQRDRVRRPLRSVTGRLVGATGAGRVRPRRSGGRVHLRPSADRRALPGQLRVGRVVAAGRRACHGLHRWAPPPAPAHCRRRRSRLPRFGRRDGRPVPVRGRRHPIPRRNMADRRADAHVGGPLTAEIGRPFRAGRVVLTIGQLTLD